MVTEVMHIGTWDLRSVERRIPQVGHDYMFRDPMQSPTLYTEPVDFYVAHVERVEYNLDGKLAWVTCSYEKPIEQFVEEKIPGWFVA